MAGNNLSYMACCIQLKFEDLIVLSKHLPFRLLTAKSIGGRYMPLNHGRYACVYRNANITSCVCVSSAVACVVGGGKVNARFRMRVELYNKILKEIKSFTGPGRTCGKYLQEKFPRYDMRSSGAFLTLFRESNSGIVI